MVTIVIGRELAVTALRSFADSRGVSIPASPLGKGKMALQVVSIFLLLLALEAPALRGAAVIVLWLVVIAALVSGADYFRRFFQDGYRAPSPTGSEPPEGEDAK